MQAAQLAAPGDVNVAASDDLLQPVTGQDRSQSTDQDMVEASQVDDDEYFDASVDLDDHQPPDSDVESDHSSVGLSFFLSFFVLINLTMTLLNPPPPLSRDRRGRGAGAMSHSVDRLFPLLTIHRVGAEVVDCQACPVDYVFQPCGTGPSSSPLAIH